MRVKGCKPTAQKRIVIFKKVARYARKDGGRGEGKVARYARKDLRGYIEIRFLASLGIAFGATKIVASLREPSRKK